MDDFHWPRILNRVLTSKWHHLKNTLVIKDFVDHLIQKRVVTLEYWMNLKGKLVTESERTEDFLSLVMKFDRQKYNNFLESLLLCGRHDLVKELAVTHDGKLVNGSEKPNVTGNYTEAAGDSPDIPAPYRKRVVEKTFTTEGKPPDKRDAGTKSYRNTATKMENVLPKPKDVAYRNKHGPEGVEAHKVDEVNNRSKLPDISKDSKRTQSANSRESILDIREKQLQIKETELERKHRELEEMERDLKHKDSDHLERESTYASSNDPQSLPTELQAANLHPSAFSTESGDILAMLREQLAELKTRMGESEDDRTPTPKYEYVKLTDMQNVQSDMEYIKEVIGKDKENREKLQKKSEEHKRVVENLHEKIASLENQKNESERQLQKQVNKLKMEMKHSKVNFNESVSGIRTELKSRASDCESLLHDVDGVQQSSVRLEDRIAVLERDNTLGKIELNKYETRMTELQTTVDRKEGELSEFKTMLQDTESDKTQLTEELTVLRDEINALRDEKRGLEQERKLLLGSCVKPQWNRNTRHSSNLK